MCQFCELPIQDAEVTDHVAFCGSRTDQCAICSRYVRKMDMEVHFTSNCEYPPRPAAASSSTRAPAFDPFAHDTGAGISSLEAELARVRELTLGERRRAAPAPVAPATVVDDNTVMCPACQAPQPDFEEMQVHMLTTCPLRGDTAATAAGVASSEPVAVPVDDDDDDDDDDSDYVPDAAPSAALSAAPSAAPSVAAAQCPVCERTFGSEDAVHKHAMQSDACRTVFFGLDDDMPDLDDVHIPDIDAPDSPAMHAPVPCEHCDLFVPFAQIADHQATCRGGLAVMGKGKARPGARAVRTPAKGKAKGKARAADSVARSRAKGKSRTTRL